MKDPKDQNSPLKRCKKAMQNGRLYLIDGTIEKRFEGTDSDWYDFYSVADGISRSF
ncbi:MAG: hypothetical protein IIB78_09085 [Proteobacteria bacterium]|nr:hypothetical protein [Pseudomonadota bacterium]